MTMNPSLALSLLILAVLGSDCSAWVSPLPRQRCAETSHVEHDALECTGSNQRRRLLIGTSAAAAMATATGLLPIPTIAAATVAAARPKALSEDYRQGTAALADMDDQAPVPRDAYKKLPSGVVYADIRAGAGPTAAAGSRCNLQWVLRKSNGYFVDSSEVQGGVPFIFVVGDGTAIQGLDEGVVGMKEGGVRRLLIPPSLAYARGLEDGMPGPLPAGFGPRQQMRRVQNIRKDVPGEYVYLEVQLTRVR